VTFHVEIDGWTAIVTVDAVAASGRVRVAMRPGRPQTPEDAPDIRELDLDVSTTDLGLLIRFADTGRLLDAAIVEQGHADYLIGLPHVTIPVRVDTGRRRADRGRAATGAGEQRIVAPMAGRIVRLLVQPGDRVEARQGIAVVEAMKMENELTSMRAGVVREVGVEPGARVEAGRLLAIIDADDGPLLP
jgi:biotin carboxyl carrier protein